MGLMYDEASLHTGFEIHWAKIKINMVIRYCMKVKCI